MEDGNTCSTKEKSFLKWGTLCHSDSMTFWEAATLKTVRRSMIAKSGGVRVSQKTSRRVEPFCLIL